MPDSVCLLALLVFVAGRCLVPMDETDLFFNLRLGDLIRARHVVPRTNLLSFTYPDARDINLAWLFQVLLSSVYAIGGIAGTVVLKTLFVLATMATLFRAARIAGASPFAMAATLALSAWAAEPRFVERPHLVTFFALGLLAVAIARAERDRPWSRAWLVPWGLVWSNANSCFFLAVGVLGLYGLGAFVDRRGARARWALGAAAIFAPCLVANPSGWHTFAYVANHVRMPWLRPLQEYRHASWPLDAPFVFVALLLGAAALLRAATRKRGHPFDGWRFLLPLAALATLGALRIRFVAEFALLSAPVIATWLTQAASAWRSRFAREELSSSRSRLVVAAALLVASLLPKLAGHLPGEPWFDLGMEPGLVPRGAIDYLEAHDLRARLYHDMEVGSYLTWDEAARGLPSHPVFQDPRINGYPEELHALLRRGDLGAAAWQAFLDRWQIRAALLCYPDSNPRAPWFSSQIWALIYRASDALVFVRRDAVDPALLSQDEIPLTFVRGTDEVTNAVPLATRPASLPECSWHQRLADFALEGDEHDRRGVALARYRAALETRGCFSASAEAAVRATAAMLALERGDPALALELTGEVSATTSEALGTARGLAHLARGSWAEAEQEFELALQRNASLADALFGSGLAREKLGRTGDAAVRFRQLLQVAPAHAGATHARAFLASSRGSPATPSRDPRGP